MPKKKPTQFVRYKVHLYSLILLLRRLTTTTRFTNGEYYNIYTILEAKTPLDMMEKETKYVEVLMWQVSSSEVTGQSFVDRNYARRPQKGELEPQK